MTVHILRLAYGMEDLDDLRRVLKQRTKKRRGRNVVTITTRFMPKRAAEAEDGGSLYWIVKGFIRARQRIVEIQEVDLELELKGGKRKRNCALHLDPELILTVPAPRRPHQGWRYLEDRDAPDDLSDADDQNIAALPADVALKLKELGLI